MVKYTQMVISCNYLKEGKINMKKNQYIFVWLVILSLFLSSACAGSSTNTSNDPTKDTDGGLAPSPNEPDTEASIGAAPPLTMDDIAAVIDGKTYNMSIDFTELYAYLGKEDELDEAPSCAYDGEDKGYNYEDISVDTIPLEKGKEFIDAYTFYTDKFSTPRGAKVGMNIDDVKALYGNVFVQDSEWTMYYLNDVRDAKTPQIIFEADETGTVIEITIFGGKSSGN
jgi:hypothetical protein